jgi:N-methylhydantoinase B
MILSIIPDKIVCEPPGLAGGRPGQRGDVYLNGERVTRFPPFRFRPGDELELKLPGGGGFGPPAERIEANVAADVRAGYVTARAARRDYDLQIEGLPT